MLRASRLHRSIALEADAKHLLTDVWTSAGVLIGLLLVGATGWLWLDAVVAIGVALNIVREGVRLIARSAHGLMDRAVEPAEQAAIDAVLARYTQQRGGHPVVHFDHVLTRTAGQRRFVNLHMHLPPSWTLGRADDLRQQVERALADAVPADAVPSAERLQARWMRLLHQSLPLRAAFNDAVQAYNQAIRQFPASLMARLFGFRPAGTVTRLAENR